MNSERRKRIEKVLERLDEIQDELHLLAEEEQDAFDNLPEGIQASERGEKMEENVSQLEEADNNVDEAKNILMELTA